MAVLAVLAVNRQAAAAVRMAPPFPTTSPKSWIGPPQSLDALRGRVILIDVWTFG